MSNRVTFDCQLEKCLFQKDGYYIYAMKIDQFKYPDIVVGKYGTTTILGNNLYELEYKQLYHVIAEPKDTKYGVSYEVVSISFDQPQTENDVRNYLMTVLTKNQAEQIMKHYPNIMDLVAQDRVDEIDIGKLKYITQRNLDIIIGKIRATSLLVNICATFYNTISLNVMQKLYSQFGSVDKIKEVLREQPYSGLCKLEGVGFRKADEILLKIEEESNAIKARGEEPKFEFKGPLKFSEDRCLACMQYYLDENEQDGNTKMKIEDLKAKVYTYAKETSIFFDKLLEHDAFFVDTINQMIGNKSTYNIEKYIAETLLNANKSPILWDFNLEPYKTLGEFKLTEQQRAVQELLCKNNVVVLNGPAGCVDCDTEFFNGTQWKKISEFNESDLVLQYNQNGSTTLVHPERYIKVPCKELYHFETKYGINQTICEDHNIVYWSKKGHQHQCKIKDVIYDQENNAYGWQGYFKTFFKYDGAGINLTDAEIKIMCAVICDGSFYNNTSEDKDSYMTCRFHLKKGRKKERLLALLNDSGVSYRHSKSATTDYDDYYIKAPRREKSFGSYWYNCSHRQLKIICDEILYWDGSFKETNNGVIRKSFSTTIKETADFIQFAFAACGYRASISINDRMNQEYLTNGKIYQRKSIEYQLTITNRRFVGICGEKKRGHTQTAIDKVQTVDGFKYCFTVPSHMLVLRRNNCIFITGNCGKSSSVKAVVQMLNDNHLDFVMGCPSAKAAKVLEKYAGFSATTIHRMLGYQSGGFTYCKTNPLQVDLVIIDESSMLDIFLFKSVLEAIDFKRTKLLLIGDTYQLPSVGAGNLLHDIINSDICPVSTLTEIFRYSEGGLISVATDTRNGKQFLPYIISPETQVISKGNSFFFCPQSKENCVDYAVKMYLKLAETNSLEDIIVITSQNKGPQGAIAINNRIQNAINPKKNDNVLQLVREDYTIEYRENDMVMQTVNDYHSIICDEYGYYERDDDGDPMHETLIANGESGRIVYVNSQNMVVKFDNYYILRHKSDLDKMSLAYAITAHKSQGSGYKNVIVVTPSTHTYMLNSNLLYVSFTRAKKFCFCIGNPKTIAIAIKKKQNLSRETFLQDIIGKIRSVKDESNVNKNN